MTSPFTSPIRGLILDMDGVLWKDNQPLIDLAAFFEKTDAMGLKVMLATNNATRTPDQHAEKVVQLGGKVRRDQVVNSSMAVAFLLKKRFPNGGPVFVVGEPSLASVLAEEGFYQAEENVLAVVAGLDRHITYEKLRAATLLIRAGAPFIGTNPDRTFPTPQGLTPGAGAILASIEAATDVAPEIAGKPSPFLFDLSLERLGLRPEETLAVGDRLDTDILGGARAGCKTALVLSGIATREDLAAWSPKPDLVAEDLMVLLEQIN